MLTPERATALLGPSENQTITKLRLSTKSFGLGAAQVAERVLRAIYANRLYVITHEEGLTPLKPWIDQVKAVSSKSQLPRLYAQAAKNGVGSPFGAYVGQDDKNPDNTGDERLHRLSAALGRFPRSWFRAAADRLPASRALL